MAKGSKIAKNGKTGQSLGRPKVEDPEEALNASMMHGKKKQAPKPKKA